MRLPSLTGRAAIGVCALSVSGFGFAQTVDRGLANPSPVPPPPPDMTLPFRAGESKAFERAAYAVFAAGALLDLYTTKRGLDAGLREQNPLLGSTANGDRTLRAAVAGKVGFALLLGNVGHGAGRNARAKWFLACGSLQLGLGIANLRALSRARTDLPP